MALSNLGDYILFIKLGHLRVKEGHLLTIIQDTGYKQSLLLATCMYGHSQWNPLIRTMDVLELRMRQGCLLKCSFKATALTSRQVRGALESAFLQVPGDSNAEFMVYVYVFLLRVLLNF